MFSHAPVLGRYVFPDAVIPETLLMFTYVLGIYGCDKFLNVSGAVRRSLENPSIACLARSPLFLPIFLPTVALAVGLQLMILKRFGSALNGGPYALELAAKGEIPYWGFLAGLYEIIFVCVILFLLSGRRGSTRLLVIGAYIFAAALRLAGGTRLILIKEIAVILIISYSQGRIKARHLGITALVVIILGSLVGLLRMSGHNEYAYLGPLYGLVMESGLNALTLNIAYQVHASGYIAHHGHALNYIVFILINAIPKFLRFGITKSQLAALSPYNAALGYGFSTYTPVGGMSGFATLTYLSNHPLLATLAVVIIFSCFAKFAPDGALKSLLILTFSINAIHFWRDPVNMAVKNCVQDTLLALVLLYVPSIKKAAIGVRTLSSRPLASHSHGNQTHES